MNEQTFTAFAGSRHLGTAELPTLLRQLFAQREQVTRGDILIFDDQTGKQADFDWRGTLEEVLERTAPQPPRRGPGRPKLGVTSREVTLLPRQWDWLEGQPGGVSATLRRLIDAERKRHPQAAAQQQARAAADRFMLTLAGDLAGYQEASRALYAGDLAAFRDAMQAWPPDIRSHAQRLAEPAFAALPAALPDETARP
ncbi:hypothetical protein GCM10017783_11790 [Deinococcus piscis]|uniref:DUF2239 domain-containing protein n=1 Tax=Deinococcus piscis TaxID=394230 RepID=A0ABQ3K535_9DEIO|nr:DUF2239 family protein [Deinococcus piscis]GHG01207.1 hypothetical protein GCM10017783_11790 [Deinococcus piscis]